MSKEKNNELINRKIKEKNDKTTNHHLNLTKKFNEEPKTVDELKKWTKNIIENLTKRIARLEHEINELRR